MKQPLSKLVRVPLREAWKHETRDCQLQLLICGQFRLSEAQSTLEVTLP